MPTPRVVDSFLKTQARIWLGEVLHTRFDEETPIADLLADGELLFQVSKVVWRKLLKKHVELKDSKIFIYDKYERTSFAKRDGKYMAYPKVDSFLQICQIIGLTGIDLFSPSDVVEKRDIHKVCLCIRSLSKKARLKHLRVPDFDIVTYTIDEPSDLVGGIHGSLEQPRRSSSSCDSNSMDFRSLNLDREEGYSGQHDQSHDYCSDSDEAESSLIESAYGSPPSNASYGACNIFNLDEEGFSEGSVGDENLSKLCAYFELEDQTHGENGCKSEHRGKSIFFESISSPCGSITGNDSHDISIALASDSCSSCIKLQMEESAFPYSLDEEQELDGQDTSSCHDPCEANRDSLVQLGSNPFGNNKLDHHMEECENISGSFRESSSDLIGLDMNYGHAMFVPTAEDSCAPTYSGESSEQTLLVKEMNTGHSHSSVLTGMFSIHDTSYVCLQHQSILNPSFNTSSEMRKDTTGRNSVNNLDPRYINEIWDKGTEGALVTNNSEVPCSHCSKDLHMEYTGTYYSIEVTSDSSSIFETVSDFEPAHCSNSANTSAPADFGDDCTRTQANWPCSNPGILVEGEGDISDETNLVVKCQADLMDDAGMSMNHAVPDVKSMGECEENLLKTAAVSGKCEEAMVAITRNPARKVLMSIVGSVTLTGILLVFLGVRAKMEKGKNSHKVVPLETKETCQEVHTQHKVGIGKDDKKYPGEKLKL